MSHIFVFCSQIDANLSGFNAWPCSGSLISAFKQFKMSATSEKDEATTPENALSKAIDDPLTKNRDLNNQSNKKEWVKFENEEEESKFNEIHLNENKVN